MTLLHCLACEVRSGFTDRVASYGSVTPMSRRPSSGRRTGPPMRLGCSAGPYLRRSRRRPPGAVAGERLSSMTPG